jgi:hypothetical protein
MAASLGRQLEEDQLFVSQGILFAGINVTNDISLCVTVVCEVYVRVVCIKGSYKPLL